MKKTILATIFGAIVSVGVVHAAPADDVKALLEQKKPLEAYNLGRANADQFGNPSFDFYYGIAAIDAGHAGEGVLALERYLLSFPDNRSARFQLARGYYVLGEDQRARDEFQTLLADASGAEKTAAERFLDAIKAREGQYTPTGSAFVELGLGYDSNINSGVPAGSQFSMGAARLTMTPLSPSALEADSFTSLAIGAQGNYPVAPGVSLYGAIGLDGRYNHQNVNDQFNQTNYGGTGGVSYLQDRNMYKLGLGVAQTMVFNQNYVQTASLNGEWQHQYDQFNRFSLGAQVAQLTFDEIDYYAFKDKSGGRLNTKSGPAGTWNEDRNSHFTALSAGWTRSFQMDYLPVLNVSASYGEEMNQGRRPDYSRDILGLRAVLSLTPAPKWGASIGATYQQNSYQDRFGLVAGNANRRDDYVALDGSIAYFYSKELSIRAELQLMKQQSNYGIFEYDRQVVGVKARYDFK